MNVFYFERKSTWLRNWRMRWMCMRREGEVIQQISTFNSSSWHRKTKDITPKSTQSNTILWSVRCVLSSGCCYSMLFHSYDWALWIVESFTQRQMHPFGESYYASRIKILQHFPSHPIVIVHWNSHFDSKNVLFLHQIFDFATTLLHVKSLFRSFPICALRFKKSEQRFRIYSSNMCMCVWGNVTVTPSKSTSRQ